MPSILNTTILILKIMGCKPLWFTPNRVYGRPSAIKSIVYHASTKEVLFDGSKEDRRTVGVISVSFPMVAPENPFVSSMSPGFDHCLAKRRRLPDK